MFNKYIKRRKKERTASLDRFNNENPELVARGQMRIPARLTEETSDNHGISTSNRPTLENYSHIPEITPRPTSILTVLTGSP